MDYTNLSEPMNTTRQETLLGKKVFIRRLSSNELDEYSNSVTAAREAGQPDRDLSLFGVNLFLSALVNEDGSRPKATLLPKAESLLAAHSTADLLDAVTTVQRHSYGTLEEARKN